MSSESSDLEVVLLLDGKALQVIVPVETFVDARYHVDVTFREALRDPQRERCEVLGPVNL